MTPVNKPMSRKPGAPIRKHSFFFKHWCDAYYTGASFTACHDHQLNTPPRKLSTAQPPINQYTSLSTSHQFHKNCLTYRHIITAHITSSSSLPQIQISHHIINLWATKQHTGKNLIEKQFYNASIKIGPLQTWYTMHSKTNAQVTLHKAQLCFCEIITPSDEHPLYLLLQNKASMAAPIELMPTEKLFLTSSSCPPVH